MSTWTLEEVPVKQLFLCAGLTGLALASLAIHSYAGC
jgi:hypothetical protein